MIEKELDHFIVDVLQRNRVDFIRIKNQSFKGKSRNYNTTAYDSEFACDKYFPDFMFFYKGNTWLIENGIMESCKTLRHKHRKLLQVERMNHMQKHGGCNSTIITSIEDAKQYFTAIGLLK